MLYDFSARLLDGPEQPLSAYRDKVVMVVNVASKCGFTPQYAGLEKLYQTYRDRGLVILGFPCNQFGDQEPGTETEIAAFCDLNYNVTFPMFSKIIVNGHGAHPLYQWLKRKAPGLLGFQAIQWNFTKFLVDRSGTRVQRFASAVEPAELVPPIEKLL
ncbi:MAG: glutathione peroxidase [Devosia sp.]|uniref:glutathione peroxidase n=1 Tax=Devosia sp. TaxID=1871048 RepID=UPI002A71E889|nr:glutathione peroxidase [Devosia sp.]